MPTDDQELIRTLRSAADESTADLHYTRPTPAVRTTSRRAPLVALAAVAVAAVAVLGAQLAPDGGDGGPPAADPSPTGTTGSWVAHDGPALTDVITHPERLDPGQPERTGPRPGEPDLCLLPAGDATSCGGKVSPPYPFLVEYDADVPASADRFPGLDGFEGETLRGWVGEDPAYGGMVWLRYADVTIRLSAAYYDTGEELASYLLEHPAGS